MIGGMVIKVTVMNDGTLKILMTFDGEKKTGTCTYEIFNEAGERPWLNKKIPDELADRIHEQMRQARQQNRVGFV